MGDTQEGMALGWRCLVSAVHPASGQLPCLARAARRVQGPPMGTFHKLDTNRARTYPGNSTERVACRCNAPLR